MQDIQPEALRPLLTTATGRVDVHVIEECDSTNAELLIRAKAGAPSGTLLIAKRQTAGRGRRGRGWHQGKNSLAFSLLWSIARPPAGLSLAVGLAVAEVLSPEATLKWPNDVLIKGRKVAGILIESAGEQRYVIGIGVNLDDDFPPDLAGAAASIAAPNRAQLFARVLDSLVVTLDEFSAHGFLPMQSRWQTRHAWQDCAVNLFFNDDDAPIEGVCRGVNAEGEMLLETATCIQTIASGEVSLRLQEKAAP